MNPSRVVVVGGGAAGFFAAITCAEAAPGSCSVTLLERSKQFLSKVRISGGGRCNVTNSCNDPATLVRFYPRGGAALRGPFNVFGPAETVDWFHSRGVPLKTEADGRMFPMSDSSSSVVECLVSSARSANVCLRVNAPVENIVRRAGGGFDLVLAGGQIVSCDRVMLATGGCRVEAGGHLAASLGHTLQPPVASLFTFRLAPSWLQFLAGVSLNSVEVALPDLGLRERGPLLITHDGVSGPAVLRLSAWGARRLHEANYQTLLRLNWLPHSSERALVAELDSRRAAHAARMLVNIPVSPLPARLWQSLVIASGIPRTIRWAELSRSAQHRLLRQLIRTEFRVVGKSLNREEFVTCGGVPTSEVDFKTMESRVCPGLFLGGELLDIDGLTGGFNFQAAWTTGWLAGKALAA